MKTMKRQKKGYRVLLLLLQCTVLMQVHAQQGAVSGEGGVPFTAPSGTQISTAEAADESALVPSDIVVVEVPDQLPDTMTYHAQTAHYVVVSEISQEHANTLASQLEALFTLYNSYFRFDAARLPAKMRVQVYGSRLDYEQYLQLTIREKREGFVYLHYHDFAKRRLVGYHMEGEGLLNSLKQQSFLQFLRAFIDNPPLWLRIGFAVYFASAELRFTDTNMLTAELAKENLALLGSLKKIFAESNPGRIIALDELWNMTSHTVIGQQEIFNAEAWGFISFLLHSPQEAHQRTLWDLLRSLGQNATLVANFETQSKVFSWTEANIYREFEDYIMTKLTYADILQRGRRYYAQRDFFNAKRFFEQARELPEGSRDYIPDYFLGLIAYEENQYSAAESYLQLSLKNVTEAHKTLIYYALGVNAYQDNRYESARTYLRKADVLISRGVNNDIQRILNRLELELE